MSNKGSIHKDSLTTQVAVAEMDKRRKKQAPELQIHASATLVMHGDPHGISNADRKDLAGEIGQFCVPIESKFVGRLKRHHIDMAFDALKHDVLKRLRGHGVMAAGE